ncbi:MAG: hypothetical protein AAFV95_17145 [Bacteroidota bacterium]
MKTSDRFEVHQSFGAGEFFLWKNIFFDFTFLGRLLYIERHKSPGEQITSIRFTHYIDVLTYNQRPTAFLTTLIDFLFCSKVFLQNA